MSNQAASWLWLLNIEKHAWYQSQKENRHISKNVKCFFWGWWRWATVNWTSVSFAVLHYSAECRMRIDEHLYVLLKTHQTISNIFFLCFYFAAVDQHHDCVQNMSPLTLIIYNIVSDGKLKSNFLHHYCLSSSNHLNKAVIPLFVQCMIVVRLCSMSDWCILG